MIVEQESLQFLDHTFLNLYNKISKKLEIENQEIEVLLTPKIKEELGLTNSYDNAFSKKYNIKTNEWVYKQDIVTSLRIDDVFLKNLKSDMELSTSPDKPKGRIIYIYITILK